MIGFFAQRRWVYRQPRHPKNLGFIRHIAWATALYVLVAQTLFAQDFPDHYDNYVNDFAHILSGSEERRLRAMLQPLREKHGIEFVVVTIGRMSDYGHNGNIEPFATDFFNYWGVGNAQRDDGVMLLVSRYDRKLRIEVGSGYGTSKDAAMKNIIDNGIVPYFRRDEYAEGIESGVELVIHNLTGFYPGEEDMNIIQRFGRRIGDFFKSLGAWSLAIIAPVLPFPMMAWRRWRRNRPRRCPNDRMQMRRVDDFADDAFLNPGQNTEERLKSVDYDVWECSACGHLTIESYRAWFTRYKLCNQCGYRTLEAEQTITKEATRSSTGERRIDYNCVNCGNSFTEYKVIPVISESSSSSSSGGSSFGGGSSSGGGASGSW